MPECEKTKLLGVSLAGTAALAAYLFVVRTWHLKWGATETEVKATLPGDELVPHPKSTATHAITINAPVAEVWSWLVQIGQDKGGFYSYSWLENLVGCHMQNADHVLPQYQRLQVGDSVLLHPKAPPLPVHICELHKTIVLGSNLSQPGTWGFYLKKLDENKTRLIIRGREGWRPSLLYWLYNRAIFEPAHFIMERKMMLGIKQRAERKRASQQLMEAALI